MVPNNFDAGLFMYLNPELVVEFNLSNINATFEWASSNILSLSNYVFSLSNLPDDFDSEVFLIAAKESANISSLNTFIKQSLSIEGFTDDAIFDRSKYIGNIYQNCLHLSNNIFQFNNPPSGSNAFRITSCNLQVGDIVRLRPINRKTWEQGYVIAINADSNLVTLSNLSLKPYKAPGTQYLIDGILVADIDRLGHINYLRNSVLPSNIYQSDTLFNPELYRLLYPRSAVLNNAAAYTEYISYQSNNERRIGKVEDFGSLAFSNAIINYADNLSINYQLRLNGPTATFVFDNTVIHGVSQDFTIQSRDLEPVKHLPNLITEYAIKKYIDQAYTNQATFCNIQVNGIANFNGSVNFNCNINYLSLGINDLLVYSNLQSFNNTQIYGGLSVYGTIDALSNLNLSSNLNVQNDAFIEGKLNVSNTVYFNSNVEVAGSLLLNNPIIVSDGRFDTLYTSNSYNSNLYTDKLISSEAILNSLDVSSNVSLCNALSVLGPTQLYSSLNVSSNVSLCNILSVLGPTQLYNSLDVSSNVSLCNVLSVQGITYLNSNLYVNGNTHLLSALHVGSNATFDSNVVISCNLDVQGITSCFRYAIGGSGNPSSYIVNSNIFANQLILQSNLIIGSSNTLGSNVITAYGTITAEAYLNTSDKRLKSNIHEIGYEQAFSILSHLNPVSYNFRNQSEEHYGFIAHELEAIIPSAVQRIGDRIVPCCIKAYKLPQLASYEKYICLQLYEDSYSAIEHIFSHDILYTYKNKTGFEVVYVDNVQHQLYGTFSTLSLPVIPEDEEKQDYTFTTQKIVNIQGINLQHIVAVLCSTVKGLCKTVRDLC